MTRTWDPRERLQRNAAREKRSSHSEMLRGWAGIQKALPDVDAQFIRDTREKLECSRALFARRLFMNERTLEKWEQGRAKPNAQAAALILLVRHFPDTLERLRRIACPDPAGRRGQPS
jgi:DNA-binding transcriptional regulator YiaG